ncbi:MAG: choice-of-anchor X domain-containing protein [Planctomycetota bacterium]
MHPHSIPSLAYTSFGILALSAFATAQTSIPRQVAAPASDILSGVVRLPAPSATPTYSRAAIQPLAFERDARGWSAVLEVAVDRAGELALALLAPDAGEWTLHVGRDGANLRPIAETFAVAQHIEFSAELLGHVVARHDVQRIEAGRWLVRVEAPAAARAPASGWLLVRTAGDVELETHVTTHTLVTDEPIGIAARLRGDVADVESARVVIESAGTTVALALHDDGSHEDGAPGDGVFGAVLPESVRGEVRARVEMRGVTRANAPFLRSAPLSFTVLERATLFEGGVSARTIGDEYVRFELAALPLAPVSRLHVSAEVWGHDESGALVPVCWLSRMETPELRAGLWTLSLDLDLAWLDVARIDRARGELELRHVRVQDPGTDAVFDQVERFAVDTPALPQSNATSHVAITPQMLTGGSAATIAGHSPARPQPKPRVPALALVHGYCSGGNVWPAADFTQPKVVFLDPNANRTHDEFAQLLDQAAQQAGLTSFGIVAHSQGGAAALHLYTYYASGLDHAIGARRIQSVATPYQGTPLASLGGFACGVNNNMTPAGAATWLAGIPTWARAEVYFWTTSNSGSTACNTLASFLLSDPEDGTVEQFRGQLPSGNSMGHVTGWCHTTGMSFPANYTDHVRNQAMNAAAAR